MSDKRKSAPVMVRRSLSEAVNEPGRKADPGPRQLVPPTDQYRYDAVLGILGVAILTACLVLAMLYLR